MPKVSYNRILDEHLHTLVAQGNHEALERLKQRYHYHSLALCHDLLNNYQKTGVSVAELMAVCEGIFVHIVEKYDPSQSTFFSFWKENTMHRMMDYLVDNSYKPDSTDINGNISLDQEFEDKHSISDFIHEVDEDREKKRKLFEIKNIIAQNDDVFTKQEAALLNLVLSGYTIADLEHGGVMSRSALYLTFKTATEKLQKLVRKAKGNKF